MTVSDIAAEAKRARDVAPAVKNLKLNMNLLP
jgi:hypothetical protein